MPWSNPGPARQVLIEGSTGDLLVYDGNPFPGDPFGALIAALSGAAGKDQFNNKFWPGLSLGHTEAVNFSINDTNQDDHGELVASIDGLLHPHLSLLGPGIGSPKAKLDMTTPGNASFLGNDTGDTGINFNPQFGGVNIFTKSGTQIGIGGTGQTIAVGLGGTAFGLIEFGTFSSTFTAQNSTAGTLTFPTAFSATPVLIGAVQVGSNLDVLVNWQSLSSTIVNWRLFQKGGVNITGNVICHWLAIGLD